MEYAPHYQQREELRGISRISGEACPTPFEGGRQDTRGYLWIGTDNGLSRYDGTEFKNFTTADGLSNLYITDIIESRRLPPILREQAGAH